MRKNEQKIKEITPFDVFRDIKQHRQKTNIPPNTNLTRKELRKLRELAKTIDCKIAYKKQKYWFLHKNGIETPIYDPKILVEE